MNFGLLKKTYEDSIKKFNQEHNGYLVSYPIRDYLDKLNHYPKIAACNYVSKEIRSFCRDMANIYGQKTLVEFHRIILMKLIIMNYNKIFTSKLPKEIVDLYKIDFERIANELIKEDYIGNLLYSDDKFRKDIGICTMRLIPVGAIKIHIDRLPLSFLLKQSKKEFNESVYYLVFKLKGYKPFYNMHLYQQTPDLMNEFNEKGWRNYYRRIAMLLEIEPKVKGIFGSSWFFDPKLKDISPHLSYLKNLVTDNGGKLFCLGPSEGAIKDSTIKSKTRYKLFLEGKYVPTRYCVVWPRYELIEWAKKSF